MSTRTRPFSIFLLKPNFDASNSLKEENCLSDAITSDLLPEGSSIFILDTPPKEPWWKGYFEIQQPLLQASKGALVFIPVQNNFFALSFGHVFHNLKDNCYEYDFGLRVTLNSLDPQKLKSADIMDPGASRRKRTQVPAATDLTFLDFDSNTEIIRSITGAVRSEFSELFKNATGSASLKVGLKVKLEDLQNICETLLNLYFSEEYLVSFPNVGKIRPEKDPDIVQELDNKLLHNFIEKNDDLSLSIPDIVDYRDNTCCLFQGRGGIASVYADVSLEAFYEYLGGDYDLSSLTIEKLKSFSIALCDADGNISRAYSIYNCLLLDVADQDKVFHICEGGWYRFDAGYIKELKTYLDAKCENTELIDYNHDIMLNGISHYSEGNYNNSVAQAVSKFICLDQTDMSPAGSSQIEPCDLYSVSASATTGDKIATLYHIKISTRSSQLSHLFNQGTNSAELLILEHTCRSALKRLITEKIGSNNAREYCEPIDSQRLKVVYGVITRKDPAALSDNLPLFSKLSLMRCFKSLELMRTPAVLTYIPDVSPPKDKYCTYPTVIVEIIDKGNGKADVCVTAGQPIAEGSKIKGCCVNIKNSPIGSKFKIFYKINTKQIPYTNHNWSYENLV